VQYTDGLPGDLSTAHPSILSDGSLLNFTRSLPNGGFHIYRQDPHTLKRTEVSEATPQLVHAAVHSIASSVHAAALPRLLAARCSGVGRVLLCTEHVHRNSAFL
jgi:hypothetical protein